MFSFILAIRIPHLCWSLFGPRGDSEGTTGVQLKCSLFMVPLLTPVGLEVPHGTWSIIVTEKNGDRKREKTAFSFLPSMGLSIGSSPSAKHVDNEHVK